MNPAALLLGARLVGVVDRLEGEIAVVEINDQTCLDLPAALFPADLREGDRVVLRGARPSLASLFTKPTTVASGAAVGRSRPAPTTFLQD